MKRNPLRALALLLMAVILTTAFVCNATYAKAETDPFTVGESTYATWAEAANAAASGDTITMNADYTDDTVEVVIPAGVTLDLNGYTLSVKSVVGVNGTHLIDGSELKTGLLVTTDGVTLSPDNASLPVWNETKGGYMLLQPNVSSTYQKFVRQTDGTYYFAFRPGFGYVDGNSVAKTILANGNNGLQMEFTVLTRETGYSSDDDGLISKEYYFDAGKLGVDDVFQHVYGNNKMFFCRLSGAEDLSQLRIKTTIYSEATGVCYTSETMTGKATMLNIDNVVLDENGNLPVNPDNENQFLLDTLKVPGSSEVTFADGVLSTTTFLGRPNARYQDLPAASVIIFEAKFDNPNYAVETTSRKYFQIRYSTDGTSESLAYLLRLRQDGQLQVVNGTVVGTWAEGQPVHVRIVIDTTVGDYGTCYVYNVTTDTTYEVPLTTPILYDYFELYGISDYGIDISELRLKADVNATFGDAMADVKLNKEITWTVDDGNNADGLRPGKITLQALNGETVVQEANVDVTQATSGAYTFENLPKYDDDGIEITYTFTAVAEHYVSSVDETGTAITLTHTPAVDTILYTQDFTDAEITRSGSYDRIASTHDTESLFRVKYATGTLAFAEETVDNATNRYVALSNTGTNGFTISKYAAPLMEVSFKVRVAEDAAFADILRIRFSNQDDAAIFAYIDTNKAIRIDGKTIPLTQDWTDVCFLIDNDAGTVKYRVGEHEGVITGLDGIATNRFELIPANSFSGLHLDDVTSKVPYAKKDVTGSIIWNDEDNADNLRTDSLTVNLYNGEFLWKTATVSEATGWAYSFTDLPVTNATADAENPTYNYRVELESIPDGYTKETEGNNFTLTHVPTEKDITLTWTWDDGNNADGLRPEKVTVAIYNGEDKVDEATVDADLGSYTFAALPVCDESESVIEYTVTVAAANYEPSADETGTAFTLTHTPADTIFYNNDFTNGSLTDPDGNALTLSTYGKFTVHEDGYLVLAGTAKKTANGTITNPSSTGRLNISFKLSLAEGATLPTDLRLRSASGYLVKIAGSKLVFNGSNSFDIPTGEWLDVSITVDINDVIDETAGTCRATYIIDGVTADEFTYKTSYGATDFVFYNNNASEYSGVLIDDLKVTALGEKTDVTGELTWADGDDADGIRPESVAVNLYEGGELIKTAVVTADENGNWNYAFKNLPAADSEGTAYDYSVTVTGLPEGYTAVPGENGNISLNYTPTKENVTVNWTWADSDNHDRIRPETVTVSLYVGEELKYSEEVSSNDLTYTFVGVPIDDYTVKIADIAGYTATEAEGTFTLTHTAVMAWFYLNDFDTEPTIETGSKYDTIYDDDDKKLSVLTGAAAYQTEGSNGFLHYANPGTQTRLFLANATAQIVDVSFKVRLVEGEFPESDMILRINGSGSDAPSKPLYFAGTKMYIRGVDNFDMSDGEWLSVYIRFDAIADELTYSVNGAEAVTVDYTLNTVNRIELYTSLAGTFTMDLDDVKIGADSSVSSDLTGTVTDEYNVATEVKLLRNGEVIDTCQIEDGAYSFTGLKAVDAEGNVYTYTLSTDAPWPTYYATTTVSKNANLSTVVVAENTTAAQTVAITWAGDDVAELTDESVTVTIEDSDGNAYSADVAVNEASVAIDAPTYTADGTAITYNTACESTASYWTVENGKNLTVTYTFDAAAYAEAQANFF